jgi:S1-C subfamily serine protease
MGVEKKVLVQVEQFCASICLLILCACVTPLAKEPTEEARAKTLRNLRLDESVRQTVVRQGCAIVLTGVQVQSTRADSKSITLTVNGSPGSVITRAVATSVDRNGYFLTAAHVLGDSPIYVIFFDGKELRSEPARVVTKLSNPEKGIESRLDLAILHVNVVDLPTTFQWADTAKIHPNDPALEIGSSGHLISETSGKIETVCFAGRVGKVLALPNGALILNTDLLSKGGDSGGPLLNLAGELLGIHIATGHSSFRRQSLANRPDLNWLRSVIAADQSVPPTANPPSLSSSDSSPPLQIIITFVGP